MKRILGLDLGTNSIGWALIENDFHKKKGEILGMGSRIIPMSQDILGKFDGGVSISATAERTGYRGTRRLYQRANLRRERLHRVLNILNFLPPHYSDSINFTDRPGQFLKGTEPKLNYRRNENGKFEFIFQESFYEMAEEFRAAGQDAKIPYDWTIYYLRKKALTKKIEKAELAWILLNFNQKRGYYQLRGTDEQGDQDNTKDQEFVVLKVEKAVPTGQRVKGKEIFKILFSNGWEYDREVTKIEDWINQEREFIVTTKTNKDGSVKRTFKKVDSESDWIAIKKKTEQEIKKSKKTVGEFIFEALLENPQQKLRGKLVKTIERKFYKEELQQILTKQTEFHNELQSEELYEKCLQELYPRNEDHQKNLKQKDFIHLFLVDIIFYQRPLKSQKFLISNCPYEKRYFSKNDKIHSVPLKCIPKSHPLFQEFRLWQFIHNLRIYKNLSTEDEKTVLNEDVTKDLLPTPEAKAQLYEFLNNRKDIGQNQILKYFSDLNAIPKQPIDEPNYRWNYVQDKKYPCNSTRSEIISRLKKVDNTSSDFLDQETEIKLWHIIYSVTDKEEFVNALKTFALKNQLNSDEFVEAFKSIPTYTSDFGSYSQKAIKKLLPLMRLGKYWKEEDVLPAAQDRIEDILERLTAIGFEKEKIESVTDDAYKKQVLKSFCNIENKNVNQGLNTYQACYAVYERHSEVSDVIMWKSPNDIDRYLKEEFKQHQLRNPIVEQIVTETLRVVRDIWQHYGNGKENFFDEIHLELGREMKNSAEVRKRLTNQLNENTNTNERIKSILMELVGDSSIKGDVRPYSKGHQEIFKLFEEGIYAGAEEDFKGVSLNEIDQIRKKTRLTKSEINRYKIWLQQGYISPYTGQMIPLSKLFTNEYEVEHIIPRSRFFDDSLSNKVICESAINPHPYKGNLTAYEFIAKMGGSIVPELSTKERTVQILNLEQYENHCKSYFKRQKKKLTLLLSEDIPEDFILRQLNDSRYISKVIMGLLSNVVREKDEQESTSKHLIPVTGKITGILKKDWGLEQVWDDLLTPRFERMNSITNSSNFRFKTVDGHGNEYFINTVPDDLAKGFTKKRLDHRHHALDALVIASATKDHVNYLNNRFAKHKTERYDQKKKLSFKTKPDAYGNYKWKLYEPWENFTIESKNRLQEIIVSFKQNKRVINKATNKYWKYKEIDGKLKKVQVRQNGQNWAIRKSLHKATYYGKIDGVKTPKGKIATAVRVPLADIGTRKRLDAITDKSIQKILNNHLKNYTDEKGKENFEEAFSQRGVNELNQNIQSLNGGKFHQPIYKVRIYEIGSKFSLSENDTKKGKYVEADKGTNLFFNIYWEEKKKKRTYETVPLEEVVAHQKMVASLPKEARTDVPINTKLGNFLFSVSPEDLIYIPTNDEIENSNIVDFEKLTGDQVERIYKMVSTTQNKLQCQPMSYAKEIQKNENGSGNKSERILGFPNKENILDEDGNLVMIKERCWKLQADRIGNLKRIG